MHEKGVKLTCVISKIFKQKKSNNYLSFSHLYLVNFSFWCNSVIIQITFIRIKFNSRTHKDLNLIQILKKNVGIQEYQKTGKIINSQKLMKWTKKKTISPLRIYSTIHKVSKIKNAVFSYLFLQTAKKILKFLRIQKIPRIMD